MTPPPRDPRTDHDPETGLIAPCPHCHFTVNPTSRGYHSGWPAKSGPWPTLRKRHPELNRDGFDDMETIPSRPSWEVCRWLDHPWRMRTPDGWVYVAEPYGLDAAAFADFAYLADKGWQVEVSAWEARHLPGRSLAVTISKPGSRHPRVKGWPAGRRT